MEQNGKQNGREGEETVLFTGGSLPPK